MPDVSSESQKAKAPNKLCAELGDKVENDRVAYP